MKHKRLDRIVEINRSLYQQQLQKMTLEINKVENELDKLSQLKTYKDFYQNELHRKFRDNADVSVLFRYTNFITSIDNAIQAQQITLESLKRNLEDMSDQAQQMKRSHNPMEKLREKMHEKHAISDYARQQSLADEICMNLTLVTSEAG